MAEEGVPAKVVLSQFPGGHRLEPLAYQPAPERLCSRSEGTETDGGRQPHEEPQWPYTPESDSPVFSTTQEFPANDRGYQALLAWMRGEGEVQAIGVESTGSFGATLTRYLTAAEVTVVEVNRPDRLARRMDRKSDRLDAEQIARGVLGGTSTATPVCWVRQPWNPKYSEGTRAAPA